MVYDNIVCYLKRVVLEDGFSWVIVVREEGIWIGFWILIKVKIDSGEEMWGFFVVGIGYSKYYWVIIGWRVVGVS